LNETDDFFRKDKLTHALRKTVDVLAQLSHRGLSGKDD
jgi:hypothetical protein